MRAVGWFWLLTAPFVSLYGALSIHDTLGTRIGGAIVAGLFWTSLSWPYLRARVTLDLDGVSVRRSFRTLVVPWNEVAGVTLRTVSFVSRVATKGLQVERRDGSHLRVRLIAVSSRRAQALEEHLQSELRRFREEHAR
jgi:hypothetical protein